MVIGVLRNSILSTDGPRRAVEVCLAVLLAVQIGRLVWMLAVPAPTTIPPPAPVAAAPDIGVFQRFDAFFRTGAAAAPVTGGGGLLLFGVRMGGPGGGSAIIGLSDGRQVSVAVGEAIEPGVVLHGVAPDSVTVMRGGAVESLAFADVPVSAPPPPPTPAEAAIAAQAAPTSTPAVAEARAVDPARLLAQVSARPRMQGLRVNGLTVSARGDGAALRAAGLKSGDVILAVNDTELNSLQAVSALRGGLTSAPTALIRYERDGRVLTTTLRTAP